MAPEGVDDDDSDESDDDDKNGVVAVTFDLPNRATHEGEVRVDGLRSVEELFQMVKREASEQAYAGVEVVEHVSVQYTNRRTGAVEEAWCDPILGESSDLRAASSCATCMSTLPPSWMSVPRPAMLVAMVIAPGWPAWAMI